MDYQFKTTFWQDFTVAEKFGTEAVLETFNRAFKEWKNDYIYLTELVLVLNWKMWDWYKKENKPFTHVYHKIWAKANNYGFEHLEGEEFAYFRNTLD